MVRRWLGGSGWLGCALTLAVARPAHAQTLPPAQLERFRLENGLEVVLEATHQDARVAVAMAYDIGTRDEPQGYEQLAHLVEHLTYRGSRHLGSLGGLEALERAGAERMNGETQDDRTLYYSVVPSGALPLALWIESERLAFTLERFTENGLRHEREVVRSEINMKLGPRSRFAAHVSTALFGENHPYSMSAWPAVDLDELKLSDAQWFFQHGYRPDNAHLVIVGDIEPAAAKALVTRYFGPVQNPKGKAPVRPAPAAAVGSKGRLHYVYPGFLTSLVTLFPAPAPGAPDHLAAELFVEMASRFLRHRLADEQDLAFRVKTGLNDRASSAELWVEVVPLKDIELSTAERALLEGLSAFFERDLGTALDEVKQQLILQELVMLEDPLLRARAHVESLTTLGKPHDTRERLQAIRSVTPADLRKLTRYLAKPLLIADISAAPKDRSVPLEGEVTTSR